MLLYPLAITLILLGLFGGLFGHDRRVYISVTACTAVAAIFDFLKALPEGVRAALHLQRRDVSACQDFLGNWMTLPSSGYFLRSGRLLPFSSTI